jgi:hypothetical protein
VQYEVDVMASVTHGIKVQQIGLAKIDPVTDLRKILYFARGKIVNATHCVTVPHQCMG